jgi:hypothetical protein
LNNRIAARHCADPGRQVVPLRAGVRGPIVAKARGGTSEWEWARHGGTRPQAQAEVATEEGARFEANGMLNEGILGAAIGVHREIEDRMQQGVSAARGGGGSAADVYTSHAGARG